MGLPVRIICGICHQSMDQPSGDPPGGRHSCSKCGTTFGVAPGGIFDVASGGIEEGTRPEPVISPRPPCSGEGTPWRETWARGSLGTLGRFQLREVLGEGAVGLVYQAYDPRLDRDVALKILKQADPGERAMQRFFREARAVARLRHPNIIMVHDAGLDEGRCWIAFEFIKGETLARRRDAGLVDPDEAVRIARDLADALEHAHGMGVFHRDLKPANVLIDERGRPWLADFGIARRADVGSDLTRDGAVLGTPSYMSPEQAVGRSSSADRRSDVYSLGVVLDELLRWRRPSSDAGAGPLRGTLGRICRRAMSPDPGRRYRDARTMGVDLGRWLDRRRAARRLVRMVAAALVAAALAILGFLGIGPRFPSSSGLAPRAATAEKVVPRPAGSPIVAGPASRYTLVGNRKTRTYHRETCSSLHTLSPANRMALVGIADAGRQSLAPCVICHPPGLEGSAGPVD